MTFVAKWSSFFSRRHSLITNTDPWLPLISFSRTWDWSVHPYYEIVFVRDLLDSLHVCRLRLCRRINIVLSPASLSHLSSSLSRLLLLPSCEINFGMHRRKLEGACEEGGEIIKVSTAKYCYRKRALCSVRVIRNLKCKTLYRSYMWATNICFIILFDI